MSSHSMGCPTTLRSSYPQRLRTVGYIARAEQVATSPAPDCPSPLFWPEDAGHEN